MLRDEKFRTIVCAECRSLYVRPVGGGIYACTMCRSSFTPRFRRGCSDKARYSSETDAGARLAMMRSARHKIEGWARMQAYPCRWCQGWHLGHVRKERA